MENLKIKLLSFLVCFSLILYAQTETQIANEIKKLGISSMSDVNAELAKRGMSEADARKMAKVYGLDYDEYLNKYIGDGEIGGSEIGGLNPFSNNSFSYSDSLTVSKLNYTIAVEETNDTLLGSNSTNTLPYFGYEIFKNNPFANKDYLVGNIDENYILGPGDEIRIYVWGAHAYQAQVRIDLNGNIALPENGIFFASGYTFATLKKKLQSFLGKSYSGLGSTPQTAFIDVSLTQLRPVSITVLGEAKTPGPHLVNGFATVLNALYAAGGIKTSGSLREVKVYRGNKLLKTIDVYNYITAGTLDEDVRLMNNDVIFISSRQSTIQLTGAVQKNAIYELKDGEGLKQLLEFAGGLLPNASAKNISIHRITPFEERSEEQIFDRYLSTVNWRKMLSEKKNFTLFDGDSISVNSILNMVLNQATISGSVNQPGSYSISAYPDLKSLIESAAKGLKPRSNIKKVDVFHTDLNGKKSFESLNLLEVLANNQNLDLTHNDSIIVYSEEHVEGEKPWVEYHSFIEEFNQQSYPIRTDWSENLSLYDLVFSYTSIFDPNFKREVLYSRIDINRYNPSSGMYKVIPFNLEDIIQKKDSVLLMPYDQVHLYSNKVHEVVNEVVYIKGYVNSPGKYILKENMSIEDLILEAGGFREFADQKMVIVSSPEYNVDEGKISSSQEIIVDNDYLLGNAEKGKTYCLKHLDEVNVRQIPGYEKMKSIIVSGEVRYPGVVNLNNKQQSLNEIIQIAGGFTQFASIDASYVLRNGTLFIVDLNRVLKDKVTFLQDGDEIMIGSNTGDVSIQGSVLNEGLFVWEKGKRARHYINNSGGLNGKIESIVVELPNGLSKRKRWFSNPKVLPNSKIYVYAKPEKVKQENSERMDKFIDALTVISSALTTVLMVQTIRSN